MYVARLLWKTIPALTLLLAAACAPVVQELAGTPTSGAVPGGRVSPVATPSGTARQGLPIITSVSFTTSDGLLLEGTLFQPRRGIPVVGPRKGVILAHMFQANEESWRRVAEDFASPQGFAVLTFNFRGYRGSQGQQDPAQIDQDLEAALDFMHRQGVEQVFLVGASMGGTAAVVVAARQEVDGIAILSAPLEFRGLNATNAVSQVTEPALFVAAQGDGDAAETARWFAGAVPVHGCALIVRGREHGTDLFEGSESGEIHKRLIGLFMDPVASTTRGCPSR